jgi:hypothetical protein
LLCDAIAHLFAVPFFAFHGLDHEDAENAIIIHETLLNQVLEET